MSDDRLKMLLAEAAPPARDLSFELAVMARIEQRRFRRDMALNIALAAATALLLGLIVPQLEGFKLPVPVPHLGDLAMAALLMAATYMGLRYFAVRD
jgi:hypothetical protein